MMPDSPVREEAARLLAKATENNPTPWAVEAPFEGATSGFEITREGKSWGSVDVVGDVDDLDVADFIAAAPTLVADLLALTASDRSEVEQLRAERDDLAHTLDILDRSQSEKELAMRLTLSKRADKRLRHRRNQAIDNELAMAEILRQAREPEPTEDAIENAAYVVASVNGIGDWFQRMAIIRALLDSGVMKLAGVVSPQAAPEATT